MFSSSITTYCHCLRRIQGEVQIENSNIPRIDSASLVSSWHFSSLLSFLSFPNLSLAEYKIFKSSNFIFLLTPEPPACISAWHAIDPQQARPAHLFSCFLGCHLALSSQSFERDFCISELSFLPGLQAPQIFQVASFHIELLVHSDFYKHWIELH